MHPPPATEHGTLFKAPMVRAIQRRLKHQTRRIVNKHRFRPAPGCSFEKDWPSVGTVRCIHEEWRAYIDAWPGVCVGTVRTPYIGDRLWVRETWTPDATQPGGIQWAADPPENRGTPPWRWRSAIHLPRNLARLVMSVKEVRVQRLLAITLEDAMAEGIPQTAGEAHELGIIDLATTPGHEWDNRTTVENYLWLWDQINGRRAPAASNPWVIATTFGDPWPAPVRMTASA